MNQEEANQLLKEAEEQFPYNAEMGDWETSGNTYNTTQDDKREGYILAIQTERQRTVKPTPESKGTQERGFRWVDFVCAEDEKDLPEYGQHVIIQYGLGDVELGNRSMIKELFENGWQNIKWSYIPSHTDFSPQQKASVSTETAEAMLKECGLWEMIPEGFQKELLQKIECYASYRSLKDGQLNEVDELLSLFISYGSINTVVGVRYPEGTHREAIDRAITLRNRIKSIQP